MTDPRLGVSFRLAPLLGRRGAGLTFDQLFLFERRVAAGDEYRRDGVLLRGLFGGRHGAGAGRGGRRHRTLRASSVR